MIILDVETTGLDPLKNSLVSIAAIDFNDSEERFYEECRAFDGADVDLGHINSIELDKEEVHDPLKKTESDIIKNFIYWLSNRSDEVVVGQDPETHILFLKAAAERAGGSIELLFEKKDLNSVALPNPSPHVGMNGALWEFEAIHRLLFDTPKLEEFKEFPVTFEQPLKKF